MPTTTPIPAPRAAARLRALIDSAARDSLAGPAPLRETTHSAFDEAGDRARRELAIAATRTQSAGASVAIRMDQALAEIRTAQTALDRATQALSGSLTGLLPHSDGVCTYCGRFEREDEPRSWHHVIEDLVAVHRAREELRVEFGLDLAGDRDDIHDLLCELAAMTPKRRI